jgi:hypothetical protein
MLYNEYNFASPRVARKAFFNIHGLVGHLPHLAPSSAPPLKKTNGLLPQSQGPRTCIE